jgi:hypothetical protein
VPNDRFEAALTDPKSAMAEEFSAALMLTLQQTCGFWREIDVQPILWTIPSGAA